MPRRDAIAMKLNGKYRPDSALSTLKRLFPYYKNIVPLNMPRAKRRAF